MRCTYPEPWITLVRLLKGVEAAACILHCSPRTLHRWAHGVTKPNRRDIALINLVFMGLGIQPPGFT